MPSPSKLDLRRLYADHGPMVLRRVLRFVPHPEADDVLQEVFLRAAERGARFRGDASPATWLYRVATNLSLDRIRQQGRRRDLLARQELVIARPGSAIAPDARVELQELFEAVSDELLEIAVLYYLDGMTHAQIAELLGVSRRTIGNRLEELAALADRLSVGAAHAT